MKKFALGALIMGLAACGGSSNNDVVGVPDANRVDGMPIVAACNVNAQTGCEAGEKCSWVRIQATPALQLGQIACVPDGDVGAGGDCQWGASGQTTGYDNCEKGLFCSAGSQVDMAPGECIDTCALDGSTVNGCDAGYVCSRYANTYANDGDTPPAGLCTEGCDPLTQKTPSDTAATFCGSGLDSDGYQIKQCVGVPSNDAGPTEFSCASVLNKTYTHNTVIPEGEVPYINACAPGTILMAFYTGPGVGDPRCLQMCRPGPTSMENPANRNGLVGDPYSLPNQDITGATEECRYLWSFEGAETPIGPYSNTLGIAYNVMIFTYSMGEPVPSCIALSEVDDPADEIDGPPNVAYGCAPYPEEANFSGVNTVKGKLGKILMTPEELNAAAQTFLAK